MAQTYSTIPEDERLDRSCSIDVDVIDKKTGRRAIIALAALAFAAGAVVSTKARGATNFAAAVAPHRGTKHWTCAAPYVDSTYGPSSGPLSAADLYVELSIGQRLPENGILRFQAGREEKITATLKSSAGPMSRVSAWAFAGNMGFGDSAPTPTGPAGITLAIPVGEPGQNHETGCWVGFWQSGPTVNTRSGARGSSLPASVVYTAPNYAYKTYAPSSITVTAFVGEQYYQSTFKLAICTAGTGC